MQFDQLRRRKFITLLGGAAVAPFWPDAARAQQAALPVVVYIDLPEQARRLALARGLAEAGYVEGQNVAIEFHESSARYDRIPELVAALIRRNVAVITTSITPAALAAKTATTTIPIVFATAADPVGLGLVASLSHPGANVTGISFFAAELAAKRLGFLRDLLPKATRVALLVNPADAVRAEATVRDVEAAARRLGLQIHVLHASTSSEIDAAFASLASDRCDALFLAPDAFFNSRRVQLAIMAARHAIPTTFGVRDYVEAGGLMSYGTSVTDSVRQVGIYAGRILKGAKPSDLPVLQPTKFELVINLHTAKALGLTVPATLQATTDEVIE
jgi:putative ABC transport system substrate-binding protein